MEWAQWIALGLVGAASVVFVPLWLVGLLHTILEHRREMRKQANLQEVLQQVQALREELSALRETTTAHQMSLQTQLERLQERIQALESEQHQALRL
ncbi:MAG: hypothetical protein RMK45_08995 [Armatimonadota bacterium]|nr:hypothetical protein [Armatimonadota bacterium]